MNRPEYVYESFIRATPEKIWEALTSAAFTRQYFHKTHVRSTWEQGAAVIYEDGEGNPMVEGRVLEADRPRRLSFTWHVLYDATMAAERPSRVTFEIEAMDSVCRLRILHDDFDTGSRTYEHVKDGWSAIICSLKSLLETGEVLALAGN